MICIHTYTMNALIIDDERTGATGLKLLLEQHCKQVKVLGIEHSAPEGIRRIRELKPDLVFLDIEMSPDTGFDVIEATRQLHYQVIFTTAYDSYAIKAFKTQAVDYLLKPIDANELKQAVKHASDRARQQQPGLNDQLESVLRNLIHPAKKIPLPSGNGVTLVAAGEILYFESDSNYTRVFLRSGNKVLVSKTLKSFEEKLDAASFCRVHAAYIVNLNEVDRYIKGDGGTLILKDKTSIPVSRAYKQELLTRIGF